MLRSRSRSSTVSPPSSPTNTKKSALSMAGIANIFIQMRRLEATAAKRANQTMLTSGEPSTHPGIVEGSKNSQKVDVEYDEEYFCVGGVNVSILLRAARSAMLDYCDGMGANALLDEQWECTISGPKPVHNGTYKVKVKYMASATKSTLPDPRRPVNLDQAKGVPGLMTIISRKGAL